MPAPSNRDDSAPNRRSLPASPPESSSAAAHDEASRRLATVVHDLKNPVLGIRRLAELILEQESLTENSRRKLTLIRSSAAEIMERLNDVLATPHDPSPMELALDPVDLAALTEAVVDQFQSHAEHKRQGLSCTVPSDDAPPCVIEGDRQKLRDAVGNLVSNALKFSPPETDVSVQVKREPNAVRVSVTDQGPGLDADDAARLFRPFQCLTPTPTGEESSSGLGLYATKHVATLHDGTIDVETDLGVGSTFHLVFPARPPDTASDRPEAPPLPARLPSLVASPYPDASPPSDR